MFCIAGNHSQPPNQKQNSRLTWARMLLSAVWGALGGRWQLMQAERMSEIFVLSSPAVFVTSARLVTPPLPK